jgi:serine protease Do
MTYSSPEEMIRAIKFSVVHISDRNGAGTGFVVSPNGHILTNDHVLPQDEALITTASGDEHEARVLARDAAVDLALLHLPGLKETPLVFADPSSLCEGQTVFALGHPMGLDFTVSRGVISSCNRERMGVSYVQTDVALNPGNSGGPIINERGEVVGVANWGIAQSQGLGFALSVRHVAAFCASMRVSIQRASAFSYAVDSDDED